MVKECSLHDELRKIGFKMNDYFTFSDFLLYLNNHTKKDSMVRIRKYIEYQRKAPPIGCHQIKHPKIDVVMNRIRRKCEIKSKWADIKTDAIKDKRLIMIKSIDVIRTLYEVIQENQSKKKAYREVLTKTNWVWLDYIHFLDLIRKYFNEDDLLISLRLNYPYIKEHLMLSDDKIDFWLFDGSKELLSSENLVCDLQIYNYFKHLKGLKKLAITNEKVDGKTFRALSEKYVCSSTQIKYFTYEVYYYILVFLESDQGLKTINYLFSLQGDYLLEKTIIDIYPIYGKLITAVLKMSFLKTIKYWPYYALFTRSNLIDENVFANRIES